MEYTDDNPEAIFDIITIQSIQERYGAIESPRGTVSHLELDEDEAEFQNEAEFETYVQQFPIDDSIAECFAFAPEVEESQTDRSKFVSGGKRPQASTTYNKLKKKFGWRNTPDENPVFDDDVTTQSRDSKRSKKRGGVFNKRHKLRKSESEHLSDNVFESISEARDLTPRDISRVYQNAGVPDFLRTDSNSFSDSQITSFTDTFIQSSDQRVPNVPDMISRENKGAKTESDEIASKTYVNDCFSAILVGDTTGMIQRMEDIPPDKALKMRDNHGNTLLHRCVLLGNHDTVKFLLEKYPDMTSDINDENETAIELAAKNGQFNCLNVMLERTTRRSALGPSLMNRLLTICAQHGQATCMNLVLSYMSRDPNCACTLPCDARGNTAAHLAAKHGHLQCLQTLVVSGYDVTSENLLQQRPLHVAHQSRNHSCFEYLLVLNVCGELLTSFEKFAVPQSRHTDNVTSVRSSLDHVRRCLGRYQELFTDIHQSLTENKVSIMTTLSKLQTDLELFIKHTSSDSAAKRKEAKEKLEELNGEIERLEDTFEFSPLSDLDSKLTSLFTSLDDAISASSTEDMHVEEADTPQQDNPCLSCLIKDVHKEYMLENWDSTMVFNKHLNRHLGPNNGSGETGNACHHLGPYSSGKYGANRHVILSQQPVAVNNKVENGVRSDTYSPSVKQLKGIDSKETEMDSNSKVTQMISSTHVGLTQIDSNKRVTQLSLKCVESKVQSDNDSLCLKTKENMDPFSAKDSKNPITDEIVKVITSLPDSRSISAFSDATNISTVNSSQHQAGTENDRTNIEDNFKTRKELHNKQDEKENLKPTERPFTKLLTLEERMDLLIAGEKARENQSDEETLLKYGERSDRKNSLLNNQDSIYTTTTFTSITTDSTSGDISDFYSKMGFNNLETSTSVSGDDVHDEMTNDVTSGSASYWWDVGEDEGPHEKNTSAQTKKVSTSFEEDVRNRIHLNLGNEDSSVEELRKERVLEHLRSVQQSRYMSENYRERITTSTGEIMGGFHSSDVRSRDKRNQLIGGFQPIERQRTDKLLTVSPGQRSSAHREVIDVNGALKRRQDFKPTPKPRKKGKQKLFTPEDEISTREMNQSEFEERYGRSRDRDTPMAASWEDMSFTDDDDIDHNSWYKQTVRDKHHWLADTSEGSLTPQSYV